jgi:hypothetical protein
LQAAIIRRRPGEDDAKIEVLRRYHRVTGGDRVAWP